MAMILPHNGPRCVASLFALLLLAGCVDSAAPLLTGAQPMFGPTVRIHGYSLSEGRANGPDVGNFRWDGAQYRVVGRPTFEVAAFTAVPLGDNDLIIQSRSSRPQVKAIEYALAPSNQAILLAYLDRQFDTVRQRPPVLAPPELLDDEPEAQNRS